MYFINQKLTTIALKIFKVDKFETCGLVYATQSGHLNVVSHLLSCDWTTDAVNDLGLAEAAQQAMVAAAKAGHEQVDLINTQSHF